MEKQRVRWTNLEGLEKYTTFSGKTALKLGIDSGAKTKYGSRVVYDLDRVDEYLESLREAKQEHSEEQ